MQHLTSTKQRDILNTQSHVEEIHKQDSTKLIEREPIENTPFWIVGNTENGYILTMGKYKVTQKKFNSIKEAREELENNTWELMLTVIAIVTNDIIEQNRPVTNNSL